MATNPQFATTLNFGHALLGSAETNPQAPTQASADIITAGAAGTKVEEIIIQAAPTSLTGATVAGLVYIYLFKTTGSVYRLYDTLTVTLVSPSATVAPFRLRVGYGNLFVPNGWTVRASQSIAGNANILECLVTGADF